MIESLKSLRKVTEYRDGCVYGTKELGEHWVSEASREAENALARSLGGDFFGPVSTKRMKELNCMTVRNRKEVAR